MRPWCNQSNFNCLQATCKTVVMLFDTKSFRYTCKVVSIHIESRFDTNWNQFDTNCSQFDTTSIYDIAPSRLPVIKSTLHHVWHCTIKRSHHIYEWFNKACCYLSAGNWVIQFYRSMSDMCEDQNSFIRIFLLVFFSYEVPQKRLEVSIEFTAVKFVSNWLQFVSKRLSMCIETTLHVYRNDFALYRNDLLSKRLDSNVSNNTFQLVINSFTGKVARKNVANITWPLAGL